MTAEVRKMVDGLKVYECRGSFSLPPIEFLSKSDVIELVEKLYTFRKEVAPSEELIEAIEYVINEFHNDANSLPKKEYYSIRKESAMQISNLPKIRANCNVNEELIELLEDAGESLELQLNRLGCQTESAPLKSGTDSLGGLSVLARLRKYIQNAKNQNQ